MQRRAHALEMIKEKIPPGFAQTVLKFYLYFRFRTSLSKEIERAKELVDLGTFVRRIRGEKVQGITFQSILDYAASSVTLNDFPVAVKSTLHCAQNKIA